MAFILSGFILTLYFLLVFNFSKEWFNAFKNKKWLFRSLYVVALIFPGLFLVWLLSGEHYIYFWDYAGYWKMAISFSESFFSEPLRSLKVLYHSMNHDEYNLLPNVFITPINKLLGLDFGSYVFSIYLIYLIPLSLIISSLCIQVVNIENEQLKLTLPLICLIFTPLMIAMRFGMLDMIGLIIVFIVLKILVGNDFLTGKGWKSALVIGLFLTLLLFTRRWYIFWVITYFPTLFLLNTIQSIAQKQRTILFNTIINLAITGVVIVSIVLVFFYPYFEMAVLKDYRDIYSAYRPSSIAWQLIGFVSFYGILMLAMSFLGAVMLFRNNDGSKKLVSFLLVSTILIVVLFSRINAFAVHHLYLLAPFIVVSYVFGATVFHSRFNKPVFTGFVAVVVLNYVSVFISPFPLGIGANTKPISPIAPSVGPYPSVGLLSIVDAKPMKRNDFSEINRISGDLAEIQNGGNHFYVLASSQILNEEIIRNTKLPNLNYYPALFVTQHVDKRDRFPHELFLANYVVVTDPSQLHLGEENQYLIGYLNEQILSGVLKNRYETVKAYTVDNDVKVYLKRKLTAPTQDELSEIRNFFRTKYPDYPSMYQIDESLAQIISAIRGDAYGRLVYEDGNLIINPGSERPSEISFALDSARNYTVSFTAGFINKEEIVRNCNPENDGEVFLTIYTNEELYDKSYLTHRKDSVYHISLSGTHGIKFQVDKGKNEDWCDWFQLGDFKITQH